jgi:hypothetical protein
MTDETPKHPGGRPSSFKPEFVQMAERLSKLGLTDVEMADIFGVSVRTLHRWKGESEEFCHSLTAGKELADTRIERSLYQRAAGYGFVEQQAIKVKVGPHEEKVEIVDVERHMPPDTTAGIFWLKNRKSGDWRDKVTQEHTGPNGSDPFASLMEMIASGGRPSPST